MKIDIIGGGKSFCPKSYKSDNTTIAVNASWQFVRCDAIIFSDMRFLQLQPEVLQQKVLKFARMKPSVFFEAGFSDDGVYFLDHKKEYGLSRTAPIVHGYCTGSAALNLAVLIGATQINLYGFDMAAGHFHDCYPWTEREHLYKEKFLPYFLSMVQEAEKVCEVNWHRK
jgi:hypothetical protein